MASAATLMQAGAQMVKLGRRWLDPETVRFLTERGVPVCAISASRLQSVRAGRLPHSGQDRPRPPRR